MSNAEFKANQYTHKLVKNIQQTAAKHSAHAAKEINKLTKENAKISIKLEKLLSRNDPNIPASNKAKSAHPFKISHNQERPDEIKISRLIEKLIINKQTIDRWQNFSANNVQPFAKFDKYLNNINPADRKQFMQELGESQFTSSTLNSLFTQLQKIEQKKEGYHQAYITLSSSAVANHATQGLTTSHIAVEQAANENGSRLGSRSGAERQASHNVNAAATLPNSVNARGVDEQKGVKAILMATEQPLTTSLAGGQTHGDLSVAPSVNTEDLNPFRSRDTSLNSLYPEKGIAGAQGNKTLAAAAVKSTSAQVNRTK